MISLCKRRSMKLTLYMGQSLSDISWEWSHSDFPSNQSVIIGPSSGTKGQRLWRSMIGVKSPASAEQREAIFMEIFGQRNILRSCALTNRHQTEKGKVNNSVEELSVWLAAHQPTGIISSAVLTVSYLTTPHRVWRTTPLFFSTVGLV